MTMKICADCRWHEKRDRWCLSGGYSFFFKDENPGDGSKSYEFHYCMQPDLTTDLVTGEQYKDRECAMFRREDGECGPEGKLFEIAEAA